MYFLMMWTALGVAFYLEYVDPLEKAQRDRRRLDDMNSELGERVDELEEELEKAEKELEAAKAQASKKTKEPTE